MQEFATYEMEESERSANHLRIPCGFIMRAKLDGYRHRTVMDIKGKIKEILCNASAPTSSVRFRKQYRIIRLHQKSVTESDLKDSELEVIFAGLAKNWQDATKSYALRMRRYAHPTYQVLMHALGKENVRDVVPLLLRELKERPDMWFEALKVLTKENPAQNSKTFDEAIAAWLEWGRREKYIS